MALHTDPINGNTVDPWVYTDFHQLFTGTMTDQPITFKPNVTMQAVAGAPGAPTATPAAGTALGIGVYKYGVTLVMADGGETLLGAQTTVTTTTGNQDVNLTAIPTGATGTTKRNIYRTLVGGSTFFLVGTINDNTTTTFSDTMTDATAGTKANNPAHPSFGGSLIIKDQNGVVQFQIFSDGSMSTGAGGLTIGNTTINGTLTVTSDSFLGGLINVGAAVSGAFANIRYASANSALQYMAPQGGASALGHLFVTWNGSAQKIPFSVGGQLAGAPAWIDNAGILTVSVSATGTALIGPSGGLAFRNNNGVGNFGITMFSGTGSGTFTHGLNTTPASVQATTDSSGSTQTMGADTYTGTSVNIRTGSGLAWTAVAFK